MINACIVLYKCTLSQSATYQSIIDNKKTGFFNSIYIYCNSPGLLDASNLPSNIVVVENDRNQMLEPNYRHFITRSKLEGVDYVCLFDQDTVIPNCYYSELSLIVSGKYARYQALYPQVVNNGRAISPMSLKRGQPKTPITNAGDIKASFIGINSGAVLNLDFKSTYDLLDSRFPLDYLDYVVSKKLLINGGGVYLMNSVIEHDLSVSSSERINTVRAESILMSEKRYIDIYGDKKDKYYLLFKMITRIIYSIIDRNYKYSTMSLWNSLWK
ncbi:hypothetical protein AL539_21585 [Vibrio alginolyticus]|nr:hypothetical protein AL539_21585 [Vibrio alginolyticus]